MAIDFPASPTDGQVYQGYRWNLAKGAWLSNNPATGSVITSATTPVGASAGDMWFNTVDGTLFIYYNDGISTNWVEVNSTSSLLGAQLQDQITNHTHDSSKIVSGTLARARIPSANYAVSNATMISVSTTTPTTIASCSLTTTGKPVLVNATGDMNPTTAPGNWNYLQLYRGETQIGKRIICESTANSVNNPWALVMIDAPSAGTYTYSVRAWQGAGTQQYGETGDVQAPQIIAVELL